MSTQVLKWAQCDVFAEARYAGNPLAIFTDGTGLTTEQMQALARETNLSETTFILPVSAEEEARDGVRVRIFTVEEELPFAGHPTLGTASWIRLNLPHFGAADEVKLQLNVGTIPVQFQAVDADARTTRAEMRQRDPEFGGVVDREALARACGLQPEDLHAMLHPQVVSMGLPFCILPLASVEALERLQIDPRATKSVLEAKGGRFVYAFAQVNATTWRARMPFNGVDDPATGSAAGCAISYLVQHHVVASNAAITIHQGLEVHRPSHLEVRASQIDDRVTDVFVGGSTIFVATGTFTHP